jgi:hypothetical protein
VVGFADDTNIMAFNCDFKVARDQLEKVYRTCERWAATRVMEFSLEKSELMYFSRAREACILPIRLGDATTAAPVQEARFLGVWLDRKLHWTAHLKAVNRKLATQQLALSRLAASAWGCSLSRAREIYVKVIRVALSYGASAFHQPTTPESGPKGIAKQMAIAQPCNLCIVAGGYRATLIQSLETETVVPLLDLYLNKQMADFEERVKQIGIDKLLRSLYKAVRARL